MSFMYQGKQVRRSTGTADRRLAESILAKVRVQIIEGRFFETREETLIKSLAEELPQDIQQNESVAKREDS